ncbi:GNAT family N-acetyltransferase [Mycobacterium sp. Aquia_216]|uniref:GNAT family N-acetyltransferase n=1 Tax=Mycobacterium sp. Aquia_216 TaxID=2991729 RepID=UPI00227ABFDF|nr:GNAT family N-acetyltransferase [Mycobacterium sp. Aquia_216]WAJ45842.1 GNAT family N-acetyltransferase [Mycobacterium sp. Aquia_216]
MSKTRLQFVAAALDDALAQPLLAELAVEYAQRYDSTPPTVLAWLQDNPSDEFAPPDGGMLIGLLDGRPVTGGGFRRFDAETAELKRIWTDSAHRRRGYAMALLAELEAQIVARGYRKVYLMTGNRQPEAEELYQATGYSRLSEPLPSEGPVFPIAFEKWLT